MSENVQKVTDDTLEPLVRGFLHGASTAAGKGLVIAHGAGADCNAPFLVAVAEAFAAIGWLVLRCDLPFRQQRPHGPPSRGSSALDQQGLRTAADFLRRAGATRVFLGGHSYGGRQASMLVAADPDVADGLLLLSYPLHPPRRPLELRTAHFPKLRTPALFVSGERDDFATPDELASALELVPARTELITIPKAPHSLLTRSNRLDLPAMIAAAFERFLQV